jgi:hypothetical protein
MLRISPGTALHGKLKNIKTLKRLDKQFQIDYLKYLFNLSRRIVFINKYIK